MELAPHIEDRVVFGNPVMKFQNVGADDWETLKPMSFSPVWSGL